MCLSRIYSRYRRDSILRGMRRENLCLLEFSRWGFWCSYASPRGSVSAPSLSLLHPHSLKRRGNEMIYELNKNLIPKGTSLRFLGTAASSSSILKTAWALISNFLRLLNTKLGPWEPLETGIFIVRWQVLYKDVKYLLCLLSLSVGTGLNDIEVIEVLSSKSITLFVALIVFVFVSPPVGVEGEDENEVLEFVSLVKGNSSVSDGWDGKETSIGEYDVRLVSLTIGGPGTSICGLYCCSLSYKA